MAGVHHHFPFHLNAFNTPGMIGFALNLKSFQKDDAEAFTRLFRKRIKCGAGLPFVSNLYCSDAPFC